MAAIGGLADVAADCDPYEQLHGRGEQTLNALSRSRRHSTGLQGPAPKSAGPSAPTECAVGPLDAGAGTDSSTGADSSRWARQSRRREAGTQLVAIWWLIGFERMASIL